MNKRLKAIDLFCGAGGVTAGFLRAGIKVSLGVDCDVGLKRTYEENNSVKYLCGDITAINGRELVKEGELNPADKIILSSCAPCQPFSLQNNKNNKGSDSRKDLGYETIRIIEELSKAGIIPEAVFIENVPEFEKSQVWSEISDKLYANRFTLVAKVVNFANYGVPQNRKRFICMAKKGYKHFDFPKETHGNGRLPYKTVAETFCGLSMIGPGEECENTPNHRTRALSPINVRRISLVPKDGGSRTVLPDELVLDCHKYYKGHQDVYGRMKSDKPSPTVTTRCISITNGRFGHPFENRGISLREAARLQTFPDEFIFKGDNLEQNSKMIGNAVPVEIARIFGQHIKEHITSG